MADQQPRTRQELYDMIRQTSKTEFILNEMKKLGFWNTEGGVPKMSEELIKKKGELNRELQELLRKKRVWQNKEKLLKEMRKKRMAEAKARREETKLKREEKRKEKAAAWKEKKEKDIIYLGKGVSAGLNKKENDEKKLKSYGLPIFKDMPALAKAMNMDIGKLRFLCYTRKVSQTTHYNRFSIPKKSGGQRIISAPMYHLKNAQYWILENVLYKMDTHNMAHGFVPEKSIITNAKPHLGKDFIVNIDLQNFFPTITYKRIKGMFRSLGYSEQISIIFSLLCSEPEIDKIELDGEIYYVAKGERFLPQGAPTSPAITNIICNKMDRRMEGMANKYGFTYSRYADDMTFSKEEEDNNGFKKILGNARNIVEDENFKIHPKKIHIMRKGSKKIVTGIVVNEKLSVPRKKLKRFRSVLHLVEKNKSLDGIQWGTGNPMNTIYGFANFVRMVDPKKGKKLIEKTRKILQDPAVKKSAEKFIISQEDRKEKTKEDKTVLSNTPQKLPEVEEGDWWNIF